MNQVIIVNYGMGNLLSIQRAIEYFGASAKVSDSPNEIVNADRLILPGVGAFGEGMKALQERHLIDAIKEFAQKEKPFMGICLGMQMMLSSSEEFGMHSGLGLIPGKVEAIPKKYKGERVKIPHIGWSDITYHHSRQASWHGTLLENIPNQEAFYFVHSFRANPTDSHCLAFTEYSNLNICAAIYKGYLTGFQFHPEKSGAIGLKIIKNFLEQ